ncbi:MAG: hypothetical protein AB8C40_01005 [Gammaproteobacteria bacterium]
MIEAKEKNEKIQLNSNELDTLDTAGIQLIYSFCKDVSQVTHSNMSDKVKEVMEGLGIESA